MLPLEYDCFEYQRKSKDFWTVKRSLEARREAK
jgi:hypothetical protein